MLAYDGAPDDLAKVGVEGSSPLARSRFFPRRSQSKLPRARSMTPRSLLAIPLVTGALLLHAGPAASADIKVLTAGAMKSVVLALQGGFETASGHRLVVDNDTAGGLLKRIEAGEAFDMAIITPNAIDGLTGKGKMVAGSRVAVAKVGVGVAVKEGTPKPDLSSVDAFKRALLSAATIAYIDPASGGSSGIYVAGLLKKLGIADEIKPKERLQAGGYVAEKVAKGEAEIAIHQISEILPVKGVTLAGPLPEEIQNYTVYAAGLSATASDPRAAQAWIDYLQSPAAASAIESRGMSKP
jgi:molybdate transport system substrate-binding protein